MRAEVVSIGEELLFGDTVDVHAATLGKLLAECGIACPHRQTVGDHHGRIVDAVRLALGRADIVLTIGGLGPTQDDITREAIAEALADEMVYEPDVERRLRELFTGRGVAWVESNARQAWRPACATLIDNALGTAPGLVCRKNGKLVVALPGPPAEFHPMVSGAVKGLLSELGEGMLVSRVLKVCGVGESRVEEILQDLMGGVNPTLAPYAKPGEVHLRLTTKAADEDAGRQILAPLEAEIRRRLGDRVYGTDDETLEAVVVQLLKGRDETVAVAESLTGGLLGSRITSVPGSGDVFPGGIISYSIEIKAKLLDVDRDTLESCGPVSEDTARAMAEGVRRRFGATYGVGLTGNAGPTSDTDNKPVGLVFIAVAGETTRVVKKQYPPADREDIRRRSAQDALISLREMIMGS